MLVLTFVLSEPKAFNCETETFGLVKNMPFLREEQARDCSR